MILTVTLNPSVDISYPLDEFKMDEVNRAGTVTKTAGGKGLNVTRVAAALGTNVMATGIIGGTIGTYIMDQLTEQKIAHRFFKIDQESRNCIAVLHEGKQTEILEAGPTIAPEEAGGFLEQFRNILAQEPISVLTISGSLPKGLTSAVYKEMIGLANQQNIPVVLDTAGTTLLEILEDPSLQVAAIKLNQDEIRAIEKQAFPDTDWNWKEILETSRYRNVDRVIITLGGDGAFAKVKDQYYQVEIPEITVVNPVGSGDATVAGIAMGIAQNLSEEDLLRTAMTTGMLNTMEETTGYANPNHFEHYFRQVLITKK